jgi:hypothetical protein
MLKAISGNDSKYFIVYDVYEHKGWANTEAYSNTVVDLSCCYTN